MIALAQYGLLSILSLMLLFHLLILLKAIPYASVWGGRLKNDQEMYRFETPSILINALFLAIALIKAELLGIHLPELAMQISLWIMAALFAFNTFGNLMSKNRLEKMVFSPITLVLCTFVVILALS
ncbi:hypothetical protein [Croceimicrobium sp.]|uniref:hypothetical protein n=1 Tax=Croceimicrobium sp. TaxID=2828340 RepID=UPI003BA94EC3